MSNPTPFKSDDLDNYPVTFTRNGDNTIATITWTKTNIDGTNTQIRQTLGYSGGQLMTISQPVIV